MNHFRAEHMIKDFSCLPYYYPEPPQSFFSQYRTLGKNESIFCNIDQLLKMSRHIDKFSATGTPEGMIKGKKLIENICSYSR